jgi:DnaJ family protein C protein 2
VNHADPQSISTIIASSNYFLPASTPAPASTIEKQLAELDLLVELLEPEQVKDLKDEVEKAGAGDGAKAALKSKVGTLGEKGEGKFTEFA